MKVDYLVTPSNDVRIFDNTSRIVSSNLLNSDKIDAYFNPINISNFFATRKALVVFRDRVKDIDKKTWALRRLWDKYAAIFLSIKTFQENIMDHIKNDIILYSANTGSLDMMIIDLFLRSGLRVVAGGSIIKTLGFDGSREHLKVFHDTPEHLLKNVMFVDGDIDKHTDLHRLIIRWEDVVVECDATNFWECEDNYFAEHFDAIDGLCRDAGVPFKPDTGIWSPGGAACVFFRSGCWWRKCTFCSYPTLKGGVNPAKKLDPEYIGNQIVKIADKCRAKDIFLTDDYFVFNHKTRKVLEILKANGKRPSVFAGIQLLSNHRYAANMAEYFGGIRIGLESINDYALKKIKKGYDTSQVRKAFENIKKYFSKDTYICTNIIMDLVSLGEDEVVKDYAVLKDIKTEMREHGFRGFFFNPNILSIYKKTKRNMIDGKLMVENDGDPTTGSFRMLEMFSMGNINMTKKEWSLYTQDYKRFDVNGNEMRSDVDIVSVEDLEFLYRR